MLKDLTTIVDNIAHLLEHLKQVTTDWKAQMCLVLQAF